MSWQGLTLFMNPSSALRKIDGGVEKMLNFDYVQNSRDIIIRSQTAKQAFQL